MPLESVKVFRYLGRPLSHVDNDWPALHWNLAKARKRWSMVSQVLTREGAAPRISAYFYQAVVQSVLLYGAETWSLSTTMLSALEGFHGRVVRRLTGRVPRFLPWEDRWIYPPLEEAFTVAGLRPLAEYISKRRNRLVEHVATRPIFALCRDAERQSGSPSRLGMWWSQLD